MAYQAVIGLELHCELKSKSKVFSKAINGYSEIPNNHIRPLDLALPGTLPVLNFHSYKEALKLALVLKCEIPEYMVFDRKNYYYPDLPKGYQITQQTAPVGINGELVIDLDGKEIAVRIHDIHLEEDTASLDHISNVTLIDYNRSGVPLIEVVTYPCMHSADEAVAFLENLRNILKFTEISDADTKLGQMRCDVNVSLRYEGDYDLRTKVEIKNVNSFANVKEAINFEINRQTKLLDEGRGNEIIQETRRFDEETGTTISMREKVEAVDYRYFVEPNIPKIKIKEELLKELKSEIPMLPRQRKKLYIDEYDLSEYDANVLIKDKDLADFYQECVMLEIDPQLASNYVTTTILSYLNKDNLNIKDLYITPEMLKVILDKQVNNEISSKQARELIDQVINEKKDVEEILKNKDVSQISDESELLKIITEVLDSNESQINDYHNGRTNLFDFFVGGVMKITRGKANPTITKEILTKELEKRK
ncbi:MAG: Asp-tRNA(Asn)/Glu-tRNA(Gln) amidotransferase subunit GatB [Mollicutes bacterium]|nr:Asp-tRNA(Asn)/Glu-tRNA(Gln) amidotransferase subunit GatB [Mollicutes bacterium]